MDDVRAAVALLPEAEIADVVSSKGDSFGIANAANLASGVLRNALRLYRTSVFEELDTSKREVLGTPRDFVQTRIYADKLKRQYANYPGTRDDFFKWRDKRDALDAALDEQLGIPAQDSKY